MYVQRSVLGDHSENVGVCMWHVTAFMFRLGTGAASALSRVSLHVYGFTV